MTTEELKSARHALGLSAEGFAALVGAKSGRTVRGWEAGERNGRPAEIPAAVAKLVRVVMDVPAAREYLGLSIKAPPSSP